MSEMKDEWLLPCPPPLKVFVMSSDLPALPEGMKLSWSEVHSPDNFNVGDIVYRDKDMTYRKYAEGSRTDGAVWEIAKDGKTILVAIRWT